MKRLKLRPAVFLAVAELVDSGEQRFVCNAFDNIAWKGGVNPEAHFFEEVYRRDAIASGNDPYAYFGSHADHDDAADHEHRIIALLLLREISKDGILFDGITAFWPPYLSRR